MNYTRTLDFLAQVHDVNSKINKGLGYIIQGLRDQDIHDEAIYILINSINDRIAELEKRNG